MRSSVITPGKDEGCQADPGPFLLLEAAVGQWGVASRGRLGLEGPPLVLKVMASAPQSGKPQGHTPCLPHSARRWSIPTCTASSHTQTLLMVLLARSSQDTRADGRSPIRLSSPCPVQVPGDSVTGLGRQRTKGHRHLQF